MKVSRTRMPKALVLLGTITLALSFGLSEGRTQEAPLAPGAPFTLTDSTGKIVHSSDFKGKWILVYFGYSHCADQCPTELSEMIDALQQMGAEAKLVQPLFITIDPERDKGQYLSDYVGQFDNRLIGLGGTPQQIATIATDYGIQFKKIPTKDGGYAFKHTSNIFVINPDGQYQVTFSHMSDSYMMATKILELISEQHSS